MAKLKSLSADPFEQIYKTVW